MAFFFVVFLVPALAALALFFLANHRVTLVEFLSMLAASLVIAGGWALGVYFGNTADVEALNGRVTNKVSVRVSCEHDYCCGWCESCSTDSKGNQSCSQYCCHTCYDHPYDVDWRVYTSLNETLNISRVDRQGVNTPPRWARVYIGEPVSLPHSYMNYIKAAPDTLFRREGDYSKYEKELPEYPDNFRDYYRLDRFVTVGVPFADAAKWNLLLDEVNADLGPAKQANVVVVFVTSKPRDYFYALERKWLGGKKNDVVVVSSVSAEGELEWVEVMAWTNQQMVKVKLRDDILALGSVNGPTFRDDFIRLLREDVLHHHKRKSMKEFAYLRASITPKPWQWMMSLIMSLAGCIGLGVWFYREDPFA